MKTRKNVYKLTGALLMLALATHCGKKDDGSDGGDGSTASIGGGGISNGTGSRAVGDAFPASLALSSFPESSSTALMLQGAEEDVTATMTVKEKIDENKRRLAGTATNCIDFRVFQNRPQSNVTCYDFDSDMNPSKFGDKEFGTTDGTHTDGSACMVAFAREEINDAISQVDRALNLVGGMFCQAKKEGQMTNLPAVGEVVDLSPSFKKAVDGQNMNITEAKISRLADIDSIAAYRSDITITDPDGQAMEVHLVHSPLTDGDKGVLWIKRPGQAPQNMPADYVDPNNEANKNHALSINYERTVNEDGTERVRLQLRRAAIVNTIDPFDSNGLVNYSALPQEAQNSTLHALQYIAFDVNPETNAGNLSYWMNPGGSYNESARGFLFNVDATENGLKGCGVSGSANNISIRAAVLEASKDLKPTGYWHPREDQNEHSSRDARYTANSGNKITKQCFKQDSTGKYIIDTAEITSARGYDVIETSASTIKLPEPPKRELKGEILPPASN